MKAAELWKTGNEALYEIWNALQPISIRKIEKKKKEDWFYEEIEGNLSYSYELTFSDNACVLDIETDGEYITLSKIFIQHKGKGLGSEILDIIKEFAFREDKKFLVVQVINPLFFSRFKWLEQTGPHVFEFNCL